MLFRDRIAFSVFIDEDRNLGGGDLADARDEVADGVRVDAIAELSFGGNLVAIGDGDLAHVVAEAGNFKVLRLVPAGGGAGPCADLGYGLGIFPEADNDLA